MGLTKNKEKKSIHCLEYAIRCSEELSTMSENEVRKICKQYEQSLYTRFCEFFKIPMLKNYSIRLDVLRTQVYMYDNPAETGE